MTTAEAIERARKFSSQYRVTDGSRFKLEDFDPADRGGLTDEHKAESKDLLREAVELLAEEQNMLYAQDRWSLLLVFQAMDAAGKDGVIKHVMSGINPQGCQVHSFKAPSAEELDHDFLWRSACRLPERGRIGIFNRSYYEEVLVVRVHPELLARQRLPERLVGDDIWAKRHKDIRRFERYLARNGTVVRKFFLHVSREEQKRRFMERLENPEKHWKFSAADIRERGHWDEYMHAYEDAIRATATKDAPWYIVPADNKWVSRLVVASAVIDAMCSLDLHYPVVGPEKRAELEAARAQLLAER
jgi:PPK2 family polyphosphate:nucleotide phosphotransferase